MSCTRDACVELEAGLPDHRPVCCRVAHRGPMPRFLVLVMGRSFEICQEAFVQGLSPRTLPLSLNVKGVKRQRAMPTPVDLVSLRLS